MADEIERSAEVDLFAKDHPDKTDSLNAIGVFCPFHESYGYYADPVDEKTATLPQGWRGRLVNLPPGTQPQPFMHGTPSTLVILLPAVFCLLATLHLSSGIVLYWITTNTFGAAQTIALRRVVKRRGS